MRPNEATSRLLTPLHLAAAANWPGAVKILLASGADKYVQDSELCFPLDFAIQTECFESVDLLLEGDCVPYFTSPLKSNFFSIPLPFYMGLIGNSERVRSALLGAIFRQKNSLEYEKLYDGLAYGPSRYFTSRASVVGRLLSEGVPGINTKNSDGYTPLMRACIYYNFEMARVLVENGASISERHTNSGLAAGHFLTRNHGHYAPPSNSADFDLRGKLLQVGFDMPNMAKFYCRCSPGGFTPITAISGGNRRAREALHSFIECLQWPAKKSEKEIRAFALAEIFDRLGMRHTCVKSDFFQRHNTLIVEEDRLEIESEEEDFNNELEKLMMEYDMLREKFDGGALEFLDYFFELQEQDLVDSNHWSSRPVNNRNDKDLLGPGKNYNFSQPSFASREILYGHTEEVREENVLGILFNEEK